MNLAARLTQDHPIVTGVLEGTAWSAAMATGVALLPERLVDWTLMAICLRCFARPMARQAALVAPMALTASVLGGAVIHVILLPMACALAAANLLTRTEQSRLWSAEHAAFAAIATAAWIPASVVYTGWLQTFLQAVTTTLIVAAVFGVIFGWGIGRAMFAQPDEPSFTRGASR